MIDNRNVFEVLVEAVPAGVTGVVPGAFGAPPALADGSAWIGITNLGSDDRANATTTAGRWIAAGRHRRADRSADAHRAAGETQGDGLRSPRL